MEYPLNINQLVNLMMPAGFSVSETFIDNTIIKWQMTLWGYFKKEVNEEDKFNILKYPDKCLNLFASLVIYETMQIALTGTFLQSLSPESSDNSASGQGGVKSIKTGPTEVEYHDTLSSLAKLISASENGEGLLKLISGQSCMYASQLGITLPWCGSISNRTHLIKINSKVPNPYTKYLNRTK